MAEARGIKIGEEVRTFKDVEARDAASAADAKAEQALTDAGEALQETVALEADLPERIKQVVAAMLPQETLLWTNPNRNENVDTLTITIANLLQYDEIKITFDNEAGSGYDSEQAVAPVRNTRIVWAYVNYIGPADIYNTLYLSRRSFGIFAQQNQIIIEKATRIDFNNGQQPILTEETNRHIPYQIFGIKYPK